MDTDDRGSDPVPPPAGADRRFLTKVMHVGCPLTEQQVHFFRHVGYVRLAETIAAEDLATLREEVKSFFAAGVEPVRRDDAGKVVRVSRVFDRSPIIRELFSSELLVAPLSTLLGPNIEFLLNRHNHATVNYVGTKSARLHRDVLQWSRAVVTAIIYLEEASLESGCTCLIPGSQFLPFVGTPNNGGTWMDEHHVYGDLLNQVVPVPMPAGGVLLFDSLAFHCAGENRTTDARFALTAAYHSVDELATRDFAHRVLVRGERLYRGDS